MQINITLAHIYAINFIFFETSGKTGLFLPLIK